MVPLLLTLALVFPPSVSSQIPVSTPTLGRVPLSQTGLHIASNGSLALAVWNDSRTGKNEVMATRIDIDGTALDPSGIVVRENASVDDLFWNGKEFVVLTGILNSSELAFVDLDGRVARRKPFHVNALYAARTDQGADTRLLFLPDDGYTPAATLTDAEGNVLKPGAAGGGGTFLAASNGTGFLVLRGNSVSERVDRDGNVLSSNDPKLPSGVPDRSGAVLTGNGRDGFALIARTGDGIVMVALDDRGVTKGPALVLQPHNPLIDRGISDPSATRTDDGFIASWAFSTTSNHSYTFVSRNGGEPAVTFDWIGIVKNTAVDPATSLVLTAYDDFFTSTGDDVFVQKEDGPPQPLTRSATMQSNAAIAPGANGFLVAWGENSGTDLRRYVRRFSATGEPQEEPRAVTVEAPQFEDYRGLPVTSVASGGDTYLVSWDGHGPRRMDARSGEWIDAEPLDLGIRSVVAVGANEHGALAVTIEPCPPALVCAWARRVELRGQALLTPPTPIPGVDSPAQFSLASNGTDFLLVWTNGATSCPFDPCFLPPPRIMAMRLRGDGTRIDAAPIEISANGQSPSVAWNGKTHLISWTTGFAGPIAAAYFSAEGAIEQLGTIAEGVSATVIAHAGEFMVFTRTVGTQEPNADEWRAKTLGGESTSIVKRPNDGFGPLAAASNGGYLMLAYDRVDEANGHIGRVLLDPRTFISRHRAALPH